MATFTWLLTRCTLAAIVLVVICAVMFLSGWRAALAACGGAVLIAWTATFLAYAAGWHRGGIRGRRFAWDVTIGYLMGTVPIVGGLYGLFWVLRRMFP